MTTVINRNASIPAKQSEIFSTGADFQDTVEIHVLQGERPLAKDNKSLGIFKLRGIPPAPRGIPRINVTFQLDVDGLLSVSAREEKSGQEQSIKIEGASVLPREDVSKMIREAEENEKLDRAKKSFITITYELDNFLMKAEKVLDLTTSSSSSENISDEESYLIEVLNQIKSFYKEKKLLACLDLSLDDLVSAVDFIRSKYINNALSNLGKENQTKGKDEKKDGKQVIDTDFDQ
jgi:molecular chaperone DnaK